MKKTIAFVLLLLPVSFSTLQAQTLVSGGIYANTTWSLANSPYIMTGSVVVFPGKTLTIEPGVEVRVKYGGIPNTGLMHYLEIRGSLVAVGTLANPITFHTDTLPTDYTWLGINVKSTLGGTINMDYFELSNSFYGVYADLQGAPTWDLHNCTFTYNNYAVQPFGPMNFYDCRFSNNGQAIGSGWQVNHNILLKRCELSNNTSCNGFQSYLSVDSCNVRDNMNGIWYAAGPITNTLFERNTYAIYAVSGAVTNCTFNDNHIALWEYAGVATNCAFAANGLAAEVAGGEVSNCTFLNDTVAIAYASSLTPSSPTPIVRLNRICGSVNYYVENKSNMNFALDQNCFCETDSTIIEGLIFDGYDDFTRGLFNYAIYDSTCTTVLQYVSKVNLPTTVGPETNASGIILYPTPASEELNVRLSAEWVQSGTTATLYDMQGRQVGATREIVEQESVWDMRALPAGVYLMRLEGPSREMLRFSKQ